MKKSFLLKLLTVILIVCASLFTFTACGIGEGDETENDEIMEIYSAYVTYSHHHGKEPLDYEEWLKSIRGEAGRDGRTPTIEISKKGFWVINGQETEYKALGENGKCTCKNCLFEDKDYSDLFIYSGNEICAITAYAKTLEEITIPARIETSDIKILADNLFENCVNLKKITIPRTLRICGQNAFKGCDKLEEVVYDGTIDQWANIIFYCSDGDLSANPLSFNTRLVIDGNFQYDITLNAKYVSEYAFAGYHNLSRVTFGPNVAVVGANAFIDCKRLVELRSNSSHITLTKGSGIATKALAVYNVTDILVESKYAVEDGFVVVSEGNEKILVQYIGNNKNLVIGNNITTIRTYAFYNDNFVESITIGDSVKTLESGSIADTKKLETLIISDSVEEMSQLSHNKALKNLVLGDGIERISESAFYGCSALKNIDFGNSIKEIGQFAFGYCGLESVTIDGAVQSIGNQVFEGCPLKEVVLGESVLTVGMEPFGSSLEKLTFSKYINTFYSYAFLWCNLKEVNFIGTIDDWAQIDFRDGSSNPLNESTKLYIDGVLQTDIIINAPIIKKLAFCGYSNLVSVTIGENVESIGESAFSGNVNLERVYYQGTQTEWEVFATNIENGNGSLTSATRYYYIENESDVPTDGGNYWHYVNGVPTAWAVNG